MAIAKSARITVERLVEETRTVYSLPFFYERLNEAINHPRSSISDIAKIITEDQGLTARLLKLSNSPMFGYYGRVDSIGKAVTIIGTQQLRDLALASSVIKIFHGIPEELISMTSFWQHSIACGIIARGLASYLRESNVERFFVAGILHDVGQLVMCAAVPEVVRGLLEASGEADQLYYAGEFGLLGFDHAEVGSALFRSWKIPASIFEPVACHHAPRQAAQFPLEAAIIHLADIICHAMEYGHSAERCVPGLEEEAWARLGLPISMLGPLLKQTEPQIEETFAILMEER